MDSKRNETGASTGYTSPVMHVPHNQLKKTVIFWTASTKPIQLIFLTFVMHFGNFNYSM